jgi:hypothetical protein
MPVRVACSVDRLECGAVMLARKGGNFVAVDEQYLRSCECPRD